ncbi:hypothetical protein GCM10023328_16900 [Modestobacter marinus]|uniref:Glyoxalase n=1 Tax=Modestobacter marinus TaxID=477641 RepID=A0ABQ2G7Z0_9ACTN|nr:hypothetical protein GCM10011589_39160 [Modestobacter marinus]
MDMELELVPVPVADTHRTKALYADRLGVTADVDVQPADGCGWCSCPCPVFVRAVCPSG